VHKEGKVLITDYGYDGEGIGRLNGKVAFVPYALKDERVTIEVQKENSSFINGKLTEVENSSPLRENPPCPYYGECGGCRYQHTSYENELEIKKNLLKQQLSKVGFQGEIKVISDECYAYRNKIRLFVGEKGLALKKRNSGELCYVDKCLIVKDEINEAIQKINVFILNGKHQRDYSEVVIRQENDCLLVDFYRSSKSEISYQGLYLILGNNFGIYETFKKDCVYRVGQRYLENKEFGLKCKFSPTSFHQVNEQVGKMLYQAVLDNLIGQNILNCYSGAGVLSGIIAKENKRVIGVELGDKEHEDAQSLKDENNLFYLTNKHGDCADILPRLNEKFDTIIVDPPRGGMDARVVEAIANFNFKRLIYVSCNSATLVRDLGRLKGLKIKKSVLLDMFARTGEYESLVVLDKI